MNFGAIAKRAEKFVARNSAVILTTIGVTGTLTTAYLTGKATFKAAEVLRQESASKYVEAHVTPDGDILPETKQSEELSFKEKFELTWKLYIPAAVCAGLTVTCIIAANRVDTRRAAALASAYSISERALDEYKAKVLEKLGEEKEKEIREDIARDRVKKNPPSKSNVIVVSGKQSLFLDQWSGRYFFSDMQTVRSALNDFNAKVINETYASLSEFWYLLGLPSTAESDEIGWSTDKLLDLDFSGDITEEGQPCVAMDFRVRPKSKYDSLY